MRRSQHLRRGKGRRDGWDMIKVQKHGLPFMAGAKNINVFPLSFLMKDATGRNIVLFILVGENTICNQVVTLPTLRHFYDLVEDNYGNFPNGDSIF